MVLRRRPCRSGMRYALVRSGGNSRIISGQPSIHSQPPEPALRRAFFLFLTSSPTTPHSHLQISLRLPAIQDSGKTWQTQP